MTTPYLGKYGAIGIGLQTAVGTPAVAPTVWLRTTQFGNPLLAYNYTTSDIADGTIFENSEFLQGVMPDQRSISFEPTLEGLNLLLPAMLGSVTTGTSGAADSIIPRLGNYAALAPGQPLTIWQLHPVRNLLMTDVQISSLVLNIGNRANVTASVTLNAVKISKLTSSIPTPSLTNANVLQFMHWYVKYGGATFKPSEGTLTIEQPIEVEDGAQGLDTANQLYGVGYERSGGVRANLRFSQGQASSPEALLAAYETGSKGELLTGFNLGTTKTLEFQFPVSRVTTVDTPTGTGRIVLPFTVNALYNGGAPTINVSKLPTLP